MEDCHWMWWRYSWYLINDPCWLQWSPDLFSVEPLKGKKCDFSSKCCQYLIQNGQANIQVPWTLPTHLLTFSLMPLVRHRSNTIFCIAPNAKHQNVNIVIVVGMCTASQRSHGCRLMVLLNLWERSCVLKNFYGFKA